MLELRGVYKSYQNQRGEVPVLSNLDFSARPGEKVAILGPSGSGKSTLLSLLAGLDQPSAGQILLSGQDLSKLDERRLTELRAKTLGIVFQQFHLMSHLSALENVALPLRILKKDQAAKLASEALSRVGLKDRLDHFPHQMSGGECQRTAIARAMVALPPVILADEPSGNLDTKTGDAVMKILFDCVTEANSTLILVTHNESLATWCSRKLLLKGGRLHEFS